MTVPVTTILAQAVTHGAVSWSADSGGPVGVEIADQAEAIEGRTGADVFPRQIFPVNQSVEIIVHLRERPSVSVGTSATLTIVLKTASSTKTYTCAAAVYLGARLTQPHQGEGEWLARFRCTASDGSTDPVS